MVNRRTFLRTAGGLAGTLLTGAWPRGAIADPIQSIQALIDDYRRNSLNSHGANVGVVAGVVTADNATRNGQLLFAGQDTLTNPNGKRLELNGRTPLEIASISKVFTSGIHYMLHGPYDGTLGSWLGGKLTMSRAVADTSLKNLAVYEPGFPQDNRGGAYPPGMMMNLRSLFDYMATFTPPFPQGSCYSYSNTGWSLLAMAAVKLANTDTQAFARTYNDKLVQFCRGFSATGTQVFRPEIKPRLPMGYTRTFAALPRATTISRPGSRATARRHRQQRRRYDAVPALQYGTPSRRPDGSGAGLSAERDRSDSLLFQNRPGPGDELRLVPRKNANAARRGRGAQQERRRRRLHVLDGLHQLAGYRIAFVPRGVRTEQQPRRHADGDQRHEASAAWLNTPAGALSRP